MLSVYKYLGNQSILVYHAILSHLILKIVFLGGRIYPSASFKKILDKKNSTKFNRASS